MPSGCLWSGPRIGALLGPSRRGFASKSDPTVVVVARSRPRPSHNDGRCSEAHAAQVGTGRLRHVGTFPQELQGALDGVHHPYALMSRPHQRL